MRSTRGWIADRIAECMAANGGIITREDLAAYRAKVREPVRGTYAGTRSSRCRRPVSGGIVLIETLNSLEGFDLPARGRYMSRRRST